MLLVISMSSCASPPVPRGQSTADASWNSYTTSDGALVFDHPTHWTVVEAAPLANDPAGGVSVRVLDAGGNTVASLDTGIIADLVCGPDTAAAYEEYDTEAMPELASQQGTEQRFVYRSLAPGTPAGGDPVATYAVISGTGDRGGCGLFDFFSLTESSGGRFAGDYPEDSAAPGQSYLDGAAAYENSPEFRDVKRMLVSLRNAG